MIPSESGRRASPEIESCVTPFWHVDSSIFKSVFFTPGSSNNAVDALLSLQKK
jgi:hypothetical protein